MFFFFSSMDVRHYLLGNKGAHVYNGNVYTCSKCKKEYKTEKGYNQHVCTFCNKCEKIFSSRQRLDCHSCNQIQ